ncbi:MAG TPA: hypothetical protein VFC15_17070 [Candidatus Limnocylindrales bacterium]|nr:hypothetical protein [Candidatus Limnocylindrales bacterium]HZM11922.1 hypothetical protein [Candidatus Limnocylindrales bacterium]
MRHQLLILQRRNQKQRLRLSVADRLLWVWLSRIWADWRLSHRLVKPKTVIAWHRRGFRLFRPTPVFVRWMKAQHGNKLI